MNVITPIAPIETNYRGYRFRSRLEARWAVFFDAAGIEWQYEPDGYKLDTRQYLPDFWFPKLDAFVEIKPTKEARDEAIPLIKELVAKTGKRGLVIGGSPNLDERHCLVEVYQSHDQQFQRNRKWEQCIFCNDIYVDKCGCGNTGDFRLYRRTLRRVEFAIGEAQRARFEHGENGRPRPYDECGEDVKVYVAGSVIEDVVETTENGEEYWNSNVVPWRINLFGEEPSSTSRDGRFQYAGPTILKDHGQSSEDLPSDCMREVGRADVVFAWIDRQDTIGTLVELGGAFAWGKPVFIGFPTEELRNQFYFPQYLAKACIITPDASSAWKCFKNWISQ